MLKLNATKSVVPTARPWLWYASDGLMIMPKR